MGETKNVDKHASTVAKASNSIKNHLDTKNRRKRKQNNDTSNKSNDKTCYQENIDYTSTGYLNQRRKEAILDADEGDTNSSENNANTRKHVLTDNNIDSRHTTKAQFSCAQCYQKFDEIFFLNNHIRFVHGSQTIASKVRVRGGHLRMKNVHSVTSLKRSR